MANNFTLIGVYILALVQGVLAGMIISHKQFENELKKYYKENIK